MKTLVFVFLLFHSPHHNDNKYHGTFEEQPVFYETYSEPMNSEACNFAVNSVRYGKSFNNIITAYCK